MCKEWEGTIQVQMPQALHGSHHLLLYLMASLQPFCGILLVVTINCSLLHCRAAVIWCCPSAFLATPPDPWWWRGQGAVPRADTVSLVVFQHSVLDLQLVGTLFPHHCSAGGELSSQGNEARCC